jgi:tetratricopeptide (TPR) repeat protein
MGSFSRRRGFGAVVLAGTLVLLSLGLLLIASPTVDAAERRPPPKAKKVQAVREWSAKRLNAAQEAMVAGNIPEALAKLDEMKKSTRINDYERALMYQSYGYAYGQQEKYAESLKAFESSVKTGALPPGAQQNTRYNIAQLYLMLEQYELGIRSLREWFEAAEDPAPSAYMLLANAYAQLGDFKSAIPPIEAALSKADTPAESWLRLAVAAYLEEERISDAARILEQLASRFSKKTYWMQLASCYGMLERQRESLSVMEVAYREGFLTESSELVRLAELYLYHGNPYRCGQALEKGLEGKLVEESRKSWELLADCWYRAQELERSIDPLAKAARLSDDGNLWLRLGQIHIEAENWGQAAEVLRKAVKKGKLKRVDRAYLLLGIASFNQGKITTAENAFREALKHEKTKSSARQWLNHIARGE